MFWRYPRPWYCDGSPGIFTCIAAIKNLVQSKQTAETPTDASNTASDEKSVVGSRCAVKFEIDPTGLFDDDDQIGGFNLRRADGTDNTGRKRSAAASTARVMPPKVVLHGCVPSSDPSTANLNAQFAGAAPPASEQAPAVTPSPSGPPPPSPKPPAPSHDATPSIPPEDIAPVVRNEDFMENMKSTAVSLPQRPQTTITTILKFVDKISTDDLQTVKEKPVEAATEKVDEIVTKFSANIRHPDLFASFSDVLKHLARFATANVVTNTASKSGKPGNDKRADFPVMYAAIIAWENHCVKIGVYAYRATYEACFESMFDSDDGSITVSDPSRVTLVLSPGSSGKACSLLALGDLVARDVPEHLILDMQMECMERKMADAMRKGWSNEVLTSYLNLFKPVPDLHERMTDQLTTLDALLFAQSRPRKSVSDALSKCRTQDHGIYHQLRYQRKGGELRKAAAGVCEGAVVTHLNVSKADKLQELLDKASVECNSDDASWPTIWVQYQELRSKTQGNDTSQLTYKPLFDSWTAASRKVALNCVGKIQAVIEPVLLDMLSKPSAKSAASALTLLKEAGDPRAERLKSAVGELTAMPAKLWVRSALCFIETIPCGIKLANDESTLAITSLSEAADKASEWFGNIKDPSLKAKAELHAGSCRAQIDKSMSRLLLSGTTTIASALSQVFGPQFQSLTVDRITAAPAAVPPPAKKRKSGDAADSAQILTLAVGTSELPRASSEVKTAATEIVSLCQLRGVSKDRIAAVISSSRLSARSLAGMQLLGDIVACLISIASHAKCESTGRLGFDIATLSSQKTADASLTAIEAQLAVRITEFRCVKTAIDSMTRTTKAGNVLKHLSQTQESSLDLSATPVELKNWSMERAQEFFGAIQKWHAASTEAVCAQVSSLVTSLTENALQICGILQEFKTANPGPHYDKTAAKTMINTNPRVTHASSYVFVLLKLKPLQAKFAEFHLMTDSAGIFK